MAGYFWLSGDLPAVESLADYRPPVVSELVSADGQVVGELFEERRRVVPYDRIPRHVVQAFLAAEDKNFFQHHGVDWLGTLRAGVNTYVLRKKIQGGSTITQQTAKALLVSSEGFAEGTRRNLRRKAREAILAARLERAFGKEELLWLYLNGVYLGHHSYGIESASENYFRKTVGELTVAEAALLAGLPQAPSRYSPVLHPEAARRRRSYVLRRMREDGAITEEVRRAADESPVRVHAIDDPFREVAPFYAEAVRRRVVERHGNPRACGTGCASRRPWTSTRSGPPSRPCCGACSTSTGARASGGRWRGSRGPSARRCAGVSPRPGRPGRSAPATSRWASSRR